MLKLRPKCVAHTSILRELLGWVERSDASAVPVGGDQLLASRMCCKDAELCACLTALAHPHPHHLEFSSVHLPTLPQRSAAADDL